MHDASSLCQKMFFVDGRLACQINWWLTGVYYLLRWHIFGFAGALLKLM